MIPTVFGILTSAFEDAWPALQTAGTMFHFDGHAEQTREILARCIIEAAKVSDRDRLRDAALAHLAEANIRKTRS